MNLCSRRPPSSSPPPISSSPRPLSFQSSSWTCFDPSFINNLIGSPVSPIIDSAYPSLPSPQYSTKAHLARNPLGSNHGSPHQCACQVQMSQQPPNPQLMGRTNVAMAVAQPKPKPASKANTTPKGKMQMHRRSRTGLWDFDFIPVIFPCCRYLLDSVD